jgi:hypothetical protein
VPGDHFGAVVSWPIADKSTAITPGDAALLASIFRDGPPTESVDRFRAVG